MLPVESPENRGLIQPDGDWRLDHMRLEDLRSSLERFIDEKTGPTQESLAEQLGVNPGTISRWLRGDVSPSLKNFDALMTAAGVDILSLARLYSPELAVVEGRNVPLISLRGMPPMSTNFDAFAERVANETDERISLPVGEGPAIALRLDEARDGFEAGDVIEVVPVKNLVPGMKVVVQLNHRNEIGIWQKRGKVEQVAIDGQPYSPDEYVLVGRIRGAWRQVR